MDKRRSYRQGGFISFKIKRVAHFFSRTQTRIPLRIRYK
jgi:hypothetical protein